MARFIVAALGAVLFAFSAAAEEAKPLKTEEAKRFIETLEPTQALAEEIQAEGNAEALALEMRPKADEPFTPYTNAVTALKEHHPAVHGRLESIVSAHGFTTQSWASVGDKVMVAYLAERMEQENPQDFAHLEAMDPAMLEMMPDSVKEQMAAAFAMMNTVKNAPEADREAIQPVMDDLDAFMDNQVAAHAMPAQ